MTGGSRFDKKHLNMKKKSYIIPEIFRIFAAQLEPQPGMIAKSAV